MMTLAEHSALICAETSQLEAEDIADCKLFLKRGAAVIWQAALWKDSLFEYTQTLTDAYTSNTSTWLPTNRILLIAPQIAQVVAVRTTDWKMDVVSSEILYRTDLDSFNTQGQTCKYRLLSPMVWQFDTVQELLFDTIFDGSTISGVQTTLDSDGLGTTKINYDYSAAQTSAGQVLGLVFLTKNAPTSGFLGVATTDGTILTLGTAATTTPQRQRIQLIGSVPDPTTVRVLGKIILPSFEDDSDIFQLTGADDCLDAYAQARMLRRERQYGKANEMKADFQALLAQLIAEQSVQQAHNKRLVPENGYGDDMMPLMGGGFTNSLW